jgi:hypothetical protein
MKRVFIYLVFIMVISMLPASGQHDTLSITKIKADSLNAGFMLFGSEDLLEVSMRLNITKYMKKNVKEPSQDAVLTFHFSDKDSLNKNIKVKYRGNFRFDNCGFPPMEISFKNHIHAYSDTDRIKKIKLVPHCDGGNMSDEYLLREFLVYKLYNIISDTSYRVRLLRINYIDTENKKKPVTHYGMFIEPNNILAQRIKATEVKVSNLTQRYIQPDIMDKVSIFNYMVSNWDWNIPYLQNVTIFKPYYNASPGSGIAVPYDFDLSGIVSPYYEVLPEVYGLSSSRDRIFLGMCRTREVFQKDLEYFLSKKSELYNTINNFQYLNVRAKKDIANLLDTFYSQLENKRSMDYLIEYLQEACKGL